jgi:flagellar hook assembly protein FlgD
MNDGGSAIPDGVYTYSINATSSETGIQATPMTGAITVDSTDPTAQIASPASNTILWNTVSITGTASDTNITSYKLEYGPSAGNGPWTLIANGTSSVNNGTLATWITNDPSLPVPIQNGSYIIRLTVTDKAGNTAISFVPVILNDLKLSDVAISANVINTCNAESSTIFFTLNSPATVALKIIPEKQGPTGTPVYQASKTCAAAGAYSFTWNGQNNTGKTVPDEAYIYILEASDGVKTYTYSPPMPTGTGSVTCAQGSSFSANKNVPLTITYTVPQPERVTISISWGPENCAIVNAVPYETGTYTFNWNGLDPGGRALDGGAAVSCSAPSLLRANHIITTGDTPQVSDLKADPYALSLSYGQFTRLWYTLSRDSLVTVSVISNLGTTVATLLSNAPQVAGTHEIDWNGLNPSDTTGKGLVISGEGAYTISVQVTNSVTGSSSTARGLVTVNY